MIKLPNITLVCVDCINHNAAIHAIKQSIKEIKFGKVLFLTDRQFYSTKFKVKIIDTIKSKEQYSEFMIKELGNYIDTEFCLVIQADGFIINPKLWDNDWLNYDYIGAPWWYDSDNVGNGGGLWVGGVRERNFRAAPGEVWSPAEERGPTDPGSAAEGIDHAAGSARRRSDVIVGRSNRLLSSQPG